LPVKINPATGALPSLLSLKRYKAEEQNQPGVEPAPGNSVLRKTSCTTLNHIVGSHSHLNLWDSRDGVGGSAWAKEEAVAATAEAFSIALIC
jgi:hypothetical protein